MPLPRLLLTDDSLASLVCNLSSLWLLTSASLASRTYLTGLEWTGRFPEAWKEMKPTTPWRELPIMENVPGVGTIGHELAILSYIAKKTGPALEGSDDKEQLTSMQLMSEAEDIYQALGRLKNGGTPEQSDLFWTDSDPTKHNRQQGLAVYLSLLENFHSSSGAGAGKFTDSGISIGEIKLWTTMHILKTIKTDVFEAFPALAAFYDRFAALPATQEFVTTGAAMGGAPRQYFKLSYE